jgi:microsomal dipeptidase-like Zn-dependent dipeptidase
VTEALLDRGYPPDGIAKILGGNFLRMFKEVWRDS